MFLLRLLLYPFSLIYDMVTRIRNHLFDIGYSRSIRFEVCVISIGNLIAGGAGKTPMVEYLLNLFKYDYPVATLSRGYGRKSRGFRLASAEDSFRTIGDEPYQLYLKFGKDIKVAVGEDRVMAVPLILNENPEVKLILLDDAFQHRQIKPHYNILLTEFNRPFFADHVLPFGRLRESRNGASRTDIVVVTKCPLDITSDQMSFFTNQIQKYTGNQRQVFFSGLAYENPVKISGDTEKLGKDIVLLSGIANSTSLKSFLQEIGFIVHRHFDFPDHHNYTAAELGKVLAFIDEKKLQVLTTEKDMVKLIVPELNKLISHHSFFYLPIKIQFINDGAIFDKLLRDLLSNYYEAGRKDA